MQPNSIFLLLVTFSCLEYEFNRVSNIGILFSSLNVIDILYAFFNCKKKIIRWRNCPPKKLIHIQVDNPITVIGGDLHSQLIINSSRLELLICMDYRLVVPSQMNLLDMNNNSKHNTERSFIIIVRRIFKGTWVVLPWSSSYYSKDMSVCSQRHQVEHTSMSRST